MALNITSGRVGFYPEETQFDNKQRRFEGERNLKPKVYSYVAKGNLFWPLRTDKLKRKKERQTLIQVAWRAWLAFKCTETQTFLFTQINFPLSS